MLRYSGRVQEVLLNLLTAAIRKNTSVIVTPVLDLAEALNLQRGRTPPLQLHY